MSFNTALTGLRAASTDLDVTGNNVANSSTIGFKQSRAEFADVYAASVTGGGSNPIGSGVRVDEVRQQFSQGSIGFTQNSLDLAINGGGFFILSEQGAQTFTRAGQFGVDDLGFIVSSSGARLQGFPANASGLVSGVLDDLQLNTANIDPRQTTAIDMQFNLDADESVLAERGNSTSANGAGVGAAQLGGVNGYTAGTIDIGGQTVSIPSAADLPANVIAAELSSQNGVTASATTTASFTVGGFPILTGDLLMNGRTITGSNSVQIAQAINALAGFTATEAGGVISVTATAGENLVFDVSNGSSGASITVNGSATITQGTANEFSTVGGTVNVQLDEGITFGGGTSNVFSGTPPLIPFVNNAFDPGDQATYNAATSVTIYDSLGIPHIMTQYFVKESSTLNPPNTWSMYIQIDGRDVGDPDPLAPVPTAPTRAQFTLRFNSDGSLDGANTDTLLISNWTPVDDQGNAVGALGPLPLLAGATLPLPEPPTSSNFLMDITGSTQFSGVFSVNDVDQNGFSTGQLSGVDISDTGVIFARYSNGEALTLGQVALADFSNEQGLTPIGDTSWAESFESGQPVVGAPRSASLGAIQAGALEESNVEIAEELVSLIIAQRNFQANARTIETANEVTQSIINLR